MSKTEYVVGDVTLCTAKHTVKVKGEDIKLTYKEIELLSLLMKN